MILINPEICNGCGLCAISCSLGAITMIVDKEGFRFPKLSSINCNQCNTCNTICPIEYAPIDKSKKMPMKEVFACQAKNQDILIEATAGGFFPVLSEYIIEKGGIVYGAAYDDKMNVIHSAAYKKSDIKRFNGSKYVQSNIENALREIQDHLKNNKIVLFSGTPCQIDAAKKACEKIEKGTLLTIDVVCYGVPSPGLFQAYLKKMERKHNARIIDYRFRDKHQNGWSHTTVVTYETPSGDHYKTTEPNYSKVPYYRMFALRDCFRKACYHCKYNTLDRCSDITTGNFWGIENISHLFTYNKGVSMVICNTDVGIELFRSIRNKLIVETHTIDEAIVANDALTKGSVYPMKRDIIYNTFANDGFDVMYKKYYKKSIVKYAFKLTKRLKMKTIDLLFRRGKEL